jgi:hypothetical protein
LPNFADDEDEYWSDFSDEDFTVEEQEEKQALQTLYRLQGWLQAYLHEHPQFDMLKVMSNFETK